MRIRILLLIITMLVSGFGSAQAVAVLPNDPPSVSQESTEQGISTFAHVTADTLVSEIVEHPAFEGFGKYIFPIKNRSTYNTDMRLDGIGSLLPYHEHIKADTTVAVINRLLDDVSDGKTVFYDFYTEEQKQADAAKQDTGLFFFRGEPNAPFAVVCPGGGFSYVGSIHESFPHALELNALGYNVFTIEYRVGERQVSYEDLAAAISFIFENADTLEVSTNDYSIWGGSAGARMAAYIGSHGAAAYGGADVPRPAAVVIAYTGHTDYVQDDTPTFTMVSDNDSIVDKSNVDSRVENMRSAGIDVEYEEYRSAGHGFGLGIGTEAEGWVGRAAAFWEKYIQQ